MNQLFVQLASALVLLSSTLTNPVATFTPHPLLQPLGKCETRNNPNIEPHIDIDGWYVYGEYQFKLETFRRYGEYYNIIAKGLTDQEIREIISTKDLQDRLATSMLNDGLWRHWTNCLTPFYEPHTSNRRTSQRVAERFTETRN